MGRFWHRLRLQSKRRKADEDRQSANALMADGTGRPRIGSGKGIVMMTGPGPRRMGNSFVWAFLWLCFVPISIGLVVALTVGTLAGFLVSLGVLLMLGVWRIAA
jgi:hypothetical protein